MRKPLPPPAGDSPPNTHNTNNQRASPNTVSVKQKLSTMFCGLCAGKMCTNKCCVFNFSLFCFIYLKI